MTGLEELWDMSCEYVDFNLRGTYWDKLDKYVKSLTKEQTNDILTQSISESLELEEKIEKGDWSLVPRHVYLLNLADAIMGVKNWR